MQHNSWEKDRELLSEAYSQVNEGFMDRFKKAIPQDAPETESESSQPKSEPSRRQIDVSVFGVKKQMDYNSLKNSSETIERIGEDPENNVELKIYETEVQDVGSYRDVPIFIPVVVINKDDYPRPPSIIAAVGKAHDKKQSAIQELQELGAKYKPGAKTEDQEEEGNIQERLEELQAKSEEFMKTLAELRQIIIDFEDVIDDINNLEAPDQMIDAVDLGLHLARLAPDTTKGSAL